MSDDSSRSTSPETLPPSLPPLAPMGGKGTALPSLASQRLFERASSVPQFGPRWSHTHEKGFRPALSACPSPTASTCSSSFSTISHVELRSGSSAGATMRGEIGPIRTRDSRTRINKSGFTRSRTGCLTCRSQKKKCDELKPICTRCKNNQHQCRYPDQRVPIAGAKQFALQAATPLARDPASIRMEGRWFPTGHSVGAGARPGTAPSERLARSREALYHRDRPGFQPLRSYSSPSVLVDRSNPSGNQDGSDSIRGPDSTAARARTSASPPQAGKEQRPLATDPARRLPPLTSLCANRPHTTTDTFASRFKLSSSSFWPASRTQRCLRSLYTSTSTIANATATATKEERRVVLPPISAFDKPVQIGRS